MLSEKAAKILLLLIRHENRTMTAGKIAGALGISERSVNTYLKEVYDFCRESRFAVPEGRRSLRGFSRDRSAGRIPRIPGSAIWSGFS